jgi:hypothetical protein
MMVVIIAESPPPIRITPPWVIIVVRVIVNWIIIFLPKVDLFAQKEGIPVIHLTKRFDFLFLNSLRVVFPAACGEFVIPAEAGIQKTGLDSASSAE